MTRARCAKNMRKYEMAPGSICALLFSSRHNRRRYIYIVLMIYFRDVRFGSLKAFKLTFLIVEHRHKHNQLSV